MSSQTDVRAFASIGPSQANTMKQNHVTAKEVVDVKHVSKTGDGGSHEIRVNATGEISLRPNRCRVTISVCNTKADCNDAHQSVNRRLDYVVQTLHNHNVKESSMKQFKTVQREGVLFKVTSQITIDFDDAKTQENVCNLLVEKLDQSVHVSRPEFYHSKQGLENLRRQASVLAMHNAKKKAQDMAHVMHQTVEQAISIREDEISEVTESPIESHMSVHEQLACKTITAVCKVTVTFALKYKYKYRFDGIIE